MKYYLMSVEHENHSLRRTAGQVLNQLIELLPKTPENDLLTAFSKLQKDDMDIVRMQGVESCITFAKKLSPSKINTYIVPYIKKYGEDKSWRLRYLLAERIVDISTYFGEELTQSKLLTQYTSFLSDTESEVRTAAISKLSSFSQSLTANDIINKIIPCLSILVNDTFQYVKIALADNILSLCPIIGKSATNEHILNIFL